VIFGVPGADAPVEGAATAVLVMCAALAFLMTVGVALFYAGMMRRINALSMVVQALAGMATVSAVWVIVGFSIAFAGGNPYVGGLGLFGVPPGADNPAGVAVPVAAFALFHMMVAVFAGTLILGAGAERWRFGAYLLFVAAWSAFVYAPVAHWIFDPAGWAAQWGVLDYGGGTVVHVTVGVAAATVAITLGRRHGWPEQAARPHNLPLAMTGLALLWLGWLGMSAGFAYGSGALAATAVLNTHVSGAAGLLAWLLVERVRHGKPTAVGAASGAVAGLVAATPSAGFVTAGAALGIGAVAGVLCHFAAGLKRWFNVDDALDVAAVHLGGGLIGCLAVGLFATTAVNPAATNGLFYSGSYRLLGIQAATVGTIAVYAVLTTFLIAALVNRIIGHRVRRRQESLGLDLSQHGEAAYDLTGQEPVVEASSSTTIAVL
jgi:Amt family ammonium transporter